MILKDGSQPPRQNKTQSRLKTMVRNNETRSLIRQELTQLTLFRVVLR